ncbi:hypothetical protein [Nocardioides sp. WS12]|uniref:hypothetical protein n=1 Tax=Nocardioides sp. WS12 TaxID=2486272 RepID=UPI0015FBD903|nr:hypothetical protein [Nocardioides sp. WS12]
MAVEVFTADGETQTHDPATGIGVTDGHLLVTLWDGAGDPTIAIYSPDRWIDARVV